MHCIAIDATITGSIKSMRIQISETITILNRSASIVGYLEDALMCLIAWIDTSLR